MVNIPNKWCGYIAVYCIIVTVLLWYTNRDFFSLKTKQVVKEVAIANQLPQVEKLVTSQQKKSQQEEPQKEEKINWRPAPSLPNVDVSS
jgi:hypothetical protein